MARIVILTGAGISAESGLGTFRDKDGLWTRYDLQEVATPQGFRRNPALVHEFYNARRANCAAASPNDAHKALARLEKALPGQVLLVTQNVDDLHQRAGSANVATRSPLLCPAGTPWLFPRRDGARPVDANNLSARLTRRIWAEQFLHPCEGGHQCLKLSSASQG